MMQIAEKTAHMANLLVTVAAFTVDPTGLTAAALAANSILTGKEIIKPISPEAKVLVKEISATLRKGLENPQFHMPADGLIHLPQMVEAGIPSAQEIVDCGVDVERLLTLMLSKHTEFDHRNPEMQQAFRNLLNPVLTRLLNDTGFVETLGPQITRDKLARMERIEQGIESMRAEMGVLSKALDDLQHLSRDQLEALASRFDIARLYDLTDAELRTALDMKAEDYRAYKAQIDGLDERVAAIANLKGAAQDAADRLDFDGVEELLAQVDITETEIAAETKVTRASNALLRGRVEQAFQILSAAADSFGSIDVIEPAARRLSYSETLSNHGLRYGGAGLPLAAEMLRNAIGNLSQEKHPDLWVHGHNRLAGALAAQGTRIYGQTGDDSLAAAVKCYHAVLEIWTRQAHPVQWAATQQNLALALQTQGICIDGQASNDLLATAVKHYNAALEVITPQAHPVNWATTQQNLANALQAQGSRTDGQAGYDLLAAALKIYNTALEVRPPQTYPVQWAMTQENMAIAQATLAQHDTCTAPLLHMQAALAHIDNALEVYDPDHMLYNFEKASHLRERILADLQALERKA